MGALGSFLVSASAPQPADIVVVLAGDSYGNRILKGAEIVRAGYAPKVLVDGPEGYFGEHESDPAIRFAVRKGYPEAWFIPFPMEAKSTTEEAAAVVAKLREWKMQRVDIVTSDYHTRRAVADFRKAGAGIEFHMVAAPDRYFSPRGWWKNREGRKIFAIEWLKTVANWIGL
jgi:uncharacterized SAM-binding protein YcdF (DUF218 family)